VENFGRSINPAKDIKAFLEIKKIATKVNPDVIHLHSSKAGALGRWAFDGKKIPLFYTPHGYSFLMQNHSPAQILIYKMVEIISGKRNCTTISCSEGEHQETLKLTKNATYVSNGINISELQNMVDSIGEMKPHPFTVFTLGRICYQKNPKLFNDIATALPDVKFVWIGDGELRNELTAPNIEITGWAEREVALRYSMNGDVFLLTSLWEGLPISLLEAMYMRKLCVVNDVIGNRDVIHNEVNGFVCHDVDNFVRIIREAQNVDVSKLVEAAYNNILTKYNTGVMAGKYSEIYMDKITAQDIRGENYSVS
jgi:glycosyltransferase involved in cell wall biosynthesis